MLGGDSGAEWKVAGQNIVACLGSFRANLDAVNPPAASTPGHRSMDFASLAGKV